MARFISMPDGLRSVLRLVSVGGVLRPVSRGATKTPYTAPPPPVDPPPGPTPADLVVSSTAAFLDPFSTVAALSQVGKRVEVTDGPDKGFFVVTDSAAASDGVTRFVHPANLSGEQVTNTLSVGTFNPTPTQFELRSVRVEVGMSNGVQQTTTWLDLHGHGAGNTVTMGGAEESLWNKRAFVNTLTGQIYIAPRMASTISANTGTKGIRYRYATGPLRLEREIPTVTLDGAQTTRYIEPKWAGVSTIPSNYVRKPARPPGPNDFSDPDTIWAYGPYEAYGAIAWASRAARQRWIEDGGNWANAALNLPEPVSNWYVRYDGLYASSWQVELSDGVTHKGAVDSPNFFLGLQAGAGTKYDPTDPDVYDNIVEPDVLRSTATWLCGVIMPKGAAEAYMAGLPNHRDLSYYKARPIAAQWQHDGNPRICGFTHGRDACRGHIKDLYIGGNLTENDYIFQEPYSSAYRAPSGPSDGVSEATNQFRNPPNWTGVNCSALAYTGERRSKTLLENVWVDGTSNGILSNRWNDFGGSNRIRVTDCPCNHFFYGPGCGAGTAIEDVVVEGDYLGHASVSNQYVLFRRYLHRQTAAANRTQYFMEATMTKRFNSGAWANTKAAGGPRTEAQSSLHWHGNEMFFEDFVVDYRQQQSLTKGFLGHTGGGLSIKGFTVLGGDDGQRQLCDVGQWTTGPREDDYFILTDFNIPHARGTTFKLSAVNILRRGIIRAPSNSPASNNGLFTMTPGRRPGSPSLLVIDDVDMANRATNNQLFATEADASGEGLGVDVYVRNSELGANTSSPVVASAPTRYYSKDTVYRTDLNAGTRYYDNVTIETPASTKDTPTWPEGVTFPEE